MMNNPHPPDPVHVPVYSALAEEGERSHARGEVQGTLFVARWRQWAFFIFLILMGVMVAVGVFLAYH